MSTKNKLKYCKYTPRQFAQRVDYLVRRFENVKRKYSIVEVDISLTGCEVNSTQRKVCGCVAGIYEVSTLPARYFPKNHIEPLAYHNGMAGVLDFLGVLENEYSQRYAPRWATFILENKLNYLWPAAGVAFGAPIAYGKSISDNLSWDEVIKSWKDFANNIRSKPDSWFFQEGLDLQHSKD